MAGDIVNRGYVVGIEGPMARVRTTRSEACAMCSARGFCHPFGEKTNEVLLKNTIGAKAGQEVQLIMKSASMVGASLFLYLLPLCFVIALAVVGHAIAGDTGLLSPEVGLLIGVCLGLVASFFAGRRLARRLEKSRTFEVEMAWPSLAADEGAPPICSQE